jgi:hypothetical protein
LTSRALVELCGERLNQLDQLGRGHLRHHALHDVVDVALAEGKVVISAMIAAR